MSLINDALKRAQEAQRTNTPSSVSSIRTIETRRKAQPLVSRMLVVVIILLLVAAVAFIGLAMTGRLARKNAVAQFPAPRPVPTVVAASPEVVAPKPVSVAVAAPAVPVAPRPVPAVVVTPLPPLVLPDTLHVQGVAYDPARPWAIVSGKMVYVGDMVKGVRVMGITRNCVIFGSNGQTNLLYVGQ